VNQQDIGEWHGKELVGLIGRHLTFVPLAGITI